LIVSHQLLQPNGTLSDEDARWSTPPMITAYHIDGENLCDEGMPPCCWLSPWTPGCQCTAV